MKRAGVAAATLSDMANPNHRPASAGTLVRARPARAVILTTGLLLRLRGIRRSDRLPG